MKIFVVLIIFLMLGCDMMTSKNATEKELTHTNGLSFRLHGAFSAVQETDQGYIIHVSPQDGRQVNQIVVQYRSEKPANLDKGKEVGGQKIYYRERADEGGSGGSEATLELWKKTDQGKGVYVEHYRQSEGRVDFTDTWALMVSAR